MALCENGIYVSLQLHRCGYKELYHRQLYQDLVGNALPAGVEIHHRDGDSRNNRAQNLEAMPLRINCFFVFPREGVGAIFFLYH